ncbi:hypothetical protein DFH94DRAFT_44994 [Russula ochroleuca]|uniref:Large ribosomal subunit protein mL49 n=1 Tax=Russula ochroleuca TaxID=152965 RepID=A0A9P5MV01_9AGAM|nr:hypothetical protein DFH94DRAFT_44994 [Russula ochroleuca]
MRSPFSFAGTTTRNFIQLASNATSGHASSLHHPKYIVPRNSRGSLPVYSDVRNGGTQYLISIRNVEGNIKALADELLRDLSDPGSAPIKARITRSNHLVLSGLRRKHAVSDWLVRHGF